MSNLGNGVCDHFTSDDVVCPPNIHIGLLTVVAADNIYYNPRTAISKKSCPGAKISLMQQHCSDDFEGSILGTLITDQSTSGKVEYPNYLLNPVYLLEYTVFCQVMHASAIWNSQY